MSLYALAVEISPDGREALVVLATNEEPYVALTATVGLAF
jgi:hypothetical protein